jgi:hypothetical protein
VVAVLVARVRRCGLRWWQIAVSAVIQAGVKLGVAVVAYFRGAGRPYPHQSLEAVEEALGTAAATRLRPQLEKLAHEVFTWPVDWDRHDLVSAASAVQQGLAARHPGLDEEALAAFGWCFSYTFM